MKKLFSLGLLTLIGLPLLAAPKQALLVTGATPSTSDLQVSNRLELLGFTVTRIADTVSQMSDATGKDLVVISSTVGSGNVSTKFTAVPVPLIDWEWAVYDELGMDSNNAGGINLTTQTQIRITDPTHPLAAGLPAGLLTVLSAPGDVASLAVPYPGAKVVATGVNSNAVIFAFEKGAPLHPARITNAPARRVGFFLANDTFRNATDAALGLFDAAVAWVTGPSARILFIVDSILGDGTANQANDREVTTRLRNQGHVVTLADDQDAGLGALFDNKDLILISSSVGSGNQPLNSLAVSDLRTRNVPIINYEPGLYDELLFQTSTTFNNPGGQVNLNITAAGQSHPLGAGNCAGLLPVATTTATMSFGSLPSSIGSEAIVIAEAADAAAGAPATFAYEAGAHLVDGTTVTPARRLALFYNASTAAGGYNAAGTALFDAALNWALGSLDTTTPVNVLRQPQDVTVNESALARFSVKVVGASPWFFQWYRDDAEITGANCGSYSIASATQGDNGAMFFAVISNSISVVTSRVASLTVVVDTNPPVMVLAIGAGEPVTTFDLVYSEPVDEGTAADNFHYTLSNGASVSAATLDADLRTVHMVANGPITNGTVVSIIDVVLDRASTPNALSPGAPGSSIAIIATAGKIRREQYNTGGGVLVSDLTNSFRFPNLPDAVDFPVLLEDPNPSQDVAAYNNYGVHLAGYVTAPFSGNYHFYMSSDDAGVLFLSTDESPSNKQIIAFEPVWANAREWTGNAGNPAGRNAAAPQNQSRTLFPAGIPLVAGQRYYIEALMKEGTGGNNLGVAWQRPGDPVPLNGSSPIPGLYLSPFTVPVSIRAGEPADQIVQENRQATFAVLPNGSPFLGYVWVGPGDLPVAAGRAFAGLPLSFTIPLVTTADNGNTYYLILTNDYSSLTSRVATLTVMADNNPPTIVSAASLNNLDIGICFSEGLDPTTATTPGNYTVNGGAITVMSATLRYDGQTVSLALSADISSGATVTVNNVTDIKGNMIAANSSATVNVAGFTPTDIGAPGSDPVALGSSFTCRDGEFEVIGGGSDVWGTADHGHFASQQITGNFDRRVKIARLDGTDPSAKGGLMVRESLAAGSRNLHAVVMPTPIAPPFLFPPTYGRNIYEAGTRVATDGPTAGWGVAGGVNGNLPALHPNSWLRLRRVGTIWKAYASSNGVDWILFGQSEQLYPDAVLFLLESTAHNNDGRTNRVLFQNLSDTVVPGVSVMITQNPEDASIDANHAVLFSAAASASGVPASEIGYQWQRSDSGGGFTNINAIGANGSLLTVFATAADNGAQFRLIASVPGASAISTAATLTVTNDVTPPRVVSARRNCAALTQVTVSFNEVLNADSATEPFNYSINDGAVAISAFVLGPDGKTVIITTGTPLTNGTVYVLKLENVADLASNGMPETKVLIRLDGGRTLVNGLVVMEAEHFDGNVSQGGKDWILLNAPGGTGTFSGSGYMQALPESGAAINEPGHLTGSPRLDYCVEFPVGGQWYVWLRGNDIVGGANSVHVGIDNTDSADPNDNRIGNSGGASGWGDGVWKWTRDADVNTRVAWVTVPTPGLHTFSVWMREDSVIVDKILLTTNSTFIVSPNTVFGPDETPTIDATPPVLLTIIYASGNVTVSWNLPAGVGTLQHADEVTGMWTDVAGASSSGYTVAASAAKKFYRVFVP